MPTSPSAPNHRIKQNTLMGQHFLSDDTILSQIADAAEIQPNDAILEIGPGLGTLTFHLLSRAQRVVAVEKDRRLLDTLQRETEKQGIKNLTLIEEDILKLPKSFLEDLVPYKVVANIPYYLTGKLFRLLLSDSPQPAMIVVTIQKEVAERITAKPPHMNLLGLAVQAYGKPEIVFPIPRHLFHPQPKVDSVVLRVRDISRKKFAESGVFDEVFFGMARKAFQAKRKMLASTLSEISGISKADMRRIMQDLSINPSARPEELDLPQWLSLIHTIERNKRKMID